MGLKLSTIMEKFPDNDHWVTLDYSKERHNFIYVLASRKTMEARTLSRILQTCDSSLEVYELCTHHLAQIGDVIELIQRFQMSPLAYSKRKELNKVAKLIFNETYEYEKYPQVKAYMKTKYDIDIEHIPKTLVREMLGI
jgi:hypothetical protein